MILYVTRHGQPALEGMPPGANHEFPPGDYALTALGRRQAEFLGRFLKKQNFAGRIISSPYARTMETAAVVAGICGVHIFPEPRLQEMRFYPEPPCPGMTLEEMRRSFPRIAPEARLPYPWMTPGGVEEPEQVRRRVDLYMEEFFQSPPAEDLLMVGHGASVNALKCNLAARAGFTGSAGYNWNCSLSRFEIDAAGNVRVLELARFDFIPLEYVTSNRRLYGDPECV